MEKPAQIAKVIREQAERFVLKLDFTRKFLQDEPRGNIRRLTKVCSSKESVINNHSVIINILNVALSKLVILKFHHSNDS